MPENFVLPKDYSYMEQSSMVSTKTTEGFMSSFRLFVRVYLAEHIADLLVESSKKKIIKWQTRLYFTFGPLRSKNVF